MWGFDEGHFQYTQGLALKDFLAGSVLRPVEEPTGPVTPAGREALDRRQSRLTNRLSSAVKDMLARRIERKLQRQA